MATRNVVITAEQDAFIHELVLSGRYQNASEAMRAGLRLLEEEESQLLALRQRLLDGMREAQAGERAQGSGADAVRRAFAEARRRSAK